MKRLSSRSLATIPLLVCGLDAAAQEPEVQGASGAVVLGVGEHRYAWDRNWGRLPSGEDLGNTHGCVVVDRDNRIYFNTDTERAVLIFDQAGELVGAWGKEWKGGLHGMTIVTERAGDGGNGAGEGKGRGGGNGDGSDGGDGSAGDERQFLYIAHTGRSEVAKTTLDGEVIWTLGYPKASGVYAKQSEYRPTSVVVGPDGDIYVADGYGKSWVHQFTKDREYVRSWGGRGTEPGKMQTPHGMLIDTRGDEPRLVVADRENHRLQIFDLDGKLSGVVDEDLRRPCNIHQHGDHLVVADLAGRVTILDADNEVVCHLGDNPDPQKRAKNGVPREQWKVGEFISPHSACWDHDGNLFVMDWLRQGRVTKLRRLD